MSTGSGEPFITLIHDGPVTEPAEEVRVPESKMEKGAVFFDAGETLVHPSPSFPELFRETCAMHGLEVDIPEVSRVTRRLMSEVEERQRNGFTFSDHPERSRRFWLDFYTRLVGELGYRGGDGLARDLYRVFSDPARYDAYPDARESLQALRERGYRLGLISNFEPWLEDLLRRLGLADFFSIMVISGREGVEKPHPRIFRIALERLGAPPGACLHVGDSPESDYRGAREAGMRAVLLDRWGRHPSFPGERISDLRELLNLLE